jgi:alkanesulfonate monooxygenase SsuD/methylene tetrahydromethanopterin reductase-like flavin-dependent oxidoreductase (luciferase family)
MLELAGELADGVILWMCTPDYVRDHVLPAVRAGLARAGRDPAGFEVVAMVQAAVTDDPAEDRAAFRWFLGSHLRVPTYRALFERSGFGADVAAGEAGDAMVEALAAIGDAGRVAAEVAAYREAGVTTVALAPTAGAHRDRGRFLQTVEAGAGG